MTHAIQLGAPLGDVYLSREAAEYASIVSQLSDHDRKRLLRLVEELVRERDCAWRPIATRLASVKTPQDIQRLLDEFTSH